MSDTDQELLENIIMKFLYTDEKVRDKVYPYLRFSLFDAVENIELIKFIKKFVQKYDKFPNPKETRLSIKKSDVYKHLEMVLDIDTSEYTSDMILGEIQDYIRERSIMDVAFKVADSVTNSDMDSVTNAPDEMREALAFSFDDSVGLDIFDASSADSIYEHMHNASYIISTGLHSVDGLIEGGFHEKTLSLLMAETNMGKSLMMGALGVNNALAGKNVLYVTCEMSEFKIGERVLANSTDISTKDMKRMSKDKFVTALERARNKIKGKFVVKEYPTGVATVNHIRMLVKELYLKKKFKPDIIYIDYIGIMSPTHKSKSDNTYTTQKRITEEVRSLAVELSLPIVSAIQTNRLGMGQDDLDLTNTSDSIGTAFTADIIIAVTQNKELKANGKFKWTIIKNRYGDNAVGLTVCVDYPKMRLSDDPDNEITVFNSSDDKDTDNKTNKTDKSSIIKKRNSVKKIANIEY